jgi:hypothetical protein
LDLNVLVKNEKDSDEMEKKFKKLDKSVKEFKEVKKVGAYTQIDFNVNSGNIVPKRRGWTSGPDDFELEIGNLLVYSVVLFDRDNYFNKIKKRYMPYYPEKLRKKRLKEVKNFLFNNLDHVPLYVKRKLYFQAFDRLYKSNQEFLQALFIKKKVYPIAYDKWIKEQFVEILKMPELYPQIVDIIQVKKLESDEMLKKYDKLMNLAKKYL